MAVPVYAARAAWKSLSQVSIETGPEAVGVHEYQVEAPVVVLLMWTGSLPSVVASMFESAMLNGTATGSVCGLAKLSLAGAPGTRMRSENDPSAGAPAELKPSTAIR